MEIKTRTSLVGFLIALSALAAPATATTTDALPAASGMTIGDRLSRLTSTLQERTTQLNELPDTHPALLLARGWADGNRGDWANGRGRGWADGSRADFANTRVGGWGDGSGGGGFANANPWRNGWADGGGFYNW